MAFYRFIFTPRLIGEVTKNYEAVSVERYGEQIISALNLLWTFSYYSSPLLLTFLYRRGYFVVESVSTIAKLSTGLGLLVAVSLCMRGLGRSQNKMYTEFVKAWEAAINEAKNLEARKQMRKYEFDFKAWPVDYKVAECSSKSKKIATARNKPLWISTLPCQILAYLAIHTFGIRMIYPGSIRLIQYYIQPMLLQGREKMIAGYKGDRNKVQTCDKNDLDTIFVDRRMDGGNGKTLVICSEGNAGFYEIGIMGTPLDLGYSVLGWNHPGFGGSTGLPYPEQDQNAVDAVMQFAINELGFLPENIILYGWSIGGYSTLFAASLYPEVRGVVLDATFDDVLQLALPRMPECLANIVQIAIRNYCNLNNNDLVINYDGPILLIRRTDDEIICSEDNVLGTNRGNFLVVHLLKHRYPNIFKNQQIQLAQEILMKPIDSLSNAKLHDPSNDQLCHSLLQSYLSDNGNGSKKKFPIEIGAEYSSEQRDEMVRFLIKKHLADYKSTHCTPLPGEYFQSPWDIPNESDFVYT